ncbi:MAG: hypothetical protein HN392_06730 [Anaerolineae bacterium]|jgi:hypothetical protein|nr:hypothetical protein [Anaerolineae bacterium]MBT7075796.1 hypothetical protein [Anaerolineae bacterium]MBT7781746.1 hypothetical protein [Anaerolineae bacterium]
MPNKFTKEIDNLKNVIRDSFRIRPNHNPVYVDVSGHLKRLSSQQHQIIFGRRGSGKSCLLIYFKNNKAKKEKIETIYLNIDEIKRLEYPDILIRLLLSIIEELPSKYRWIHKFNPFPDRLKKTIKELRSLLDEASESKITQNDGDTTGLEGSLTADKAILKAKKEKKKERTTEYTKSKLNKLERHLSDYKSSLQYALKKTRAKSIYFLVDDFYLIPKNKQPDVIDYLHRLLRSTNFYLKVGTIRHRTKLIRNENQTIGVELHQDVEEINLDRTFENLESTTNYLSEMLDSIAEKVGIEKASEQLFNRDALQSLVLASGGVPRDFLNIFVEAIDYSLSSTNPRWLTPTNIWKGAGRLSYRTKINNLRNEASDEVSKLERVYRDLVRFCLEEKKTTAFLVSQAEVQQKPQIHELINQLMDFKLIHVIEPDTSAASGRKGRFEAYTLDFSLFMEPRKRYIKLVEFWKFDDNYRKIGIREAPIYELSRAEQALMTDDGEDTEELIEKIDSQDK